METCRVERGKPHERETQNLVGALLRRNSTERRKELLFFRQMIATLKYPTVWYFRGQNMAYRAKTVPFMIK